MKLLSTLFATLALTGSVFMAPKAMAADIEIEGTECTIHESDGYDWYIEFTDGTFSVYLDIMTGSEDVFFGSYTAEDCYNTMQGSPYDSHIYTNDDAWYDFTNDDLAFTITDMGNGNWKIEGTASIAEWNNDTFDYEPTKTVHFVYDSTPAQAGDVVTITNAGYATYYNHTKAVLLPAGVTAYVVSVNSDGTSLNFVEEYAEGSVVPEQTPVVLKGSGEVTLNYTTGGVTPSHTNLLKGAATAMSQIDMYNANPGCLFYALMFGEENNVESVGFYYAATDGMAFAIEAGKAYLPVDPNTTSARGFAFADATGIRNINAEAQATTIFNLNGQRAAEAKGLVVRQGKMMFVK